MKKIQSRSAGVLMALSSLPGKYGCGDFGESAYRFIDFAKKAGFRLWQLLPLNPLGYGHSPYQPFSSNAMSDLYLSLDALVKERLLDEVPPFNADADRVDYEAVAAFRLPYLKAAFAKAKKKGYSPRGFLARNRWAKNWAYFMMNKRRFGCSWDQWPEENRKWIDGPRRIKKKDREDYEFEIWLQEKLFEQFAKLRAYAKKNHILLMGDMPFYVGYDSNDVYANKDQFLLDPETAQPTSVAGVPPDYFSPTGQRWGNPIYDWDKLIKTDYRFFADRVGFCGKMFDLVRLDHFRAFDTYWKIPASEETAMVGEWVEAPGKDFFNTLLRKYPDLDIIAEDLGDLRPEVLQLRDLFHFPGMNVIEFTFPDQIFAKKDGFDEPNSVCYLGTHDNETIVGFIKDTLKEGAKQWDEELIKLGYTEGDLAHKLIRFCLDKKCILAVISVQDILGLDNAARTNKPGCIDDKNWTWRMPRFDELEAKIPEIKELIARSKR